jgi:hypothetical protein
MDGQEVVGRLNALRSSPFYRTTVVELHQRAAPRQCAS